MSEISTNYLTQRLGGLSNYSKPKPVKDEKLVNEKFDSFQKDFDRISDLKGVDRAPMGYFAGMKDTAPRDSGDVNVLGVGSLRQTANGCVLQVLRKGMHGIMLGSVTYEFDKAQQKVKTTEVNHALSAGFLNRPASTTSYTMDLQNRSVDDYLITPGDKPGTQAIGGQSAGGGALKALGGLAPAPRTNGLIGS